MAEQNSGYFWACDEEGNAEPVFVAPNGKIERLGSADWWTEHDFVSVGPRIERPSDDQHD